MFWWGKPITLTGSYILVLGLLFTLVLANINPRLQNYIPDIIYKSAIMLDIVGAIIALIGFTFVCISEIWGPYI